MNQMLNIKGEVKRPIFLKIKRNRYKDIKRNRYKDINGSYEDEVYEFDS